METESAALLLTSEFDRNPAPEAKCCGCDGKSKHTEPVSSWVVLLVAFFIDVLVVLPHNTFPVIYDSLVERFHTDRATVGWIYSIFLVFNFIVGIFFSPFTTTYGCRKVGFVSSVIYTTGLTLAAIAPNIPTLLLFYGVIGGIGSGGGMLVATTAVQQAFTTHREMATSMLYIGYSVGIFLGPVIMHRLFVSFGLFGSLLLQGGIMAHGLFLALLLDIHQSRRSVNKKLEETETSIKHEKTCRCTTADNPTTLNETREAQIGERNSEKVTFKKLFLDMFDFSLLRIPAFLAYVCHYSLLFFSEFGWIAQIDSAAVFRGLSADVAANLLVIMGVVSVAVRIVLALVLNFVRINPLILASVGTASFIASSILSSLAQSQTQFVIAAIIAGFIEGLSATVVPLAIIYIIGAKRIVHGYALALLGVGPGSLIAGSLTGWLFDISGDYAYSFAATAVGAFVATVCSVIAYFLTKNNRQY